MGHYAKDLKFGRAGKTYHLPNIDYENLPSEIASILSIYSNHIDGKHFNKENIFLNKNGVDYAIWFRQMKKSETGNRIKLYLRVQTLYPVGLPEHLIKIRKLSKKQIDNGIAFYTD